MSERKLNGGMSAEVWKRSTTGGVELPPVESVQRIRSPRLEALEAKRAQLLRMTKPHHSEKRSKVSHKTSIDTKIQHLWKSATFLQPQPPGNELGVHVSSEGRAIRHDYNLEASRPNTYRDMGWKTNWHGDHDETAPWTPSTSLRGNLIHPGPAVSGRENGPAPGSLTARGRLEGLVHSSSSLTESEKNETLPSLHKLSELREQLQHQMEVLKQSSRPIESMLQTEGSYSSSRESVRTKRLRQQAGFGEPFRAPQIVVDAREELRLRFDTAAEAFVFIDFVGGCNFSLTESALTRAFKVLRISLSPAKLWQYLKDRSKAVDSRTWEIRMSWHPERILSDQAYLTAKTSIQRIRAEAMEASARIAPATRWTAPTDLEALRNILDVLHRSPEQFHTAMADEVAAGRPALGGDRQSEARWRGSAGREGSAALSGTLAMRSSLSGGAAVLPQQGGGEKAAVGGLSLSGLLLYLRKICLVPSLLDEESVVALVQEVLGGGALPSHDERVPLIDFQLFRKFVTRLAQQLRVPTPDLSSLSPIPPQVITQCVTEQDGRRRTEVTVRGEERRLQMQRKLAGTKAAVRALATIHRLVSDDSHFLRYCQAGDHHALKPLGFHDHMDESKFFVLLQRTGFLATSVGSHGTLADRQQKVHKLVSSELASAVFECASKQLPRTEADKLIRARTGNRTAERWQGNGTLSPEPSLDLRGLSPEPSMGKLQARRLDRITSGSLDGRVSRASSKSGEKRRSSVESTEGGRRASVEGGSASGERPKSKRMTLRFEEFKMAMRLLAEKIDPSVSSFLFPHFSTQIPFSSALGKLLEVHSLRKGMLSALNMEELLVLGEFVHTKRLAEGLTFCDPRSEATQSGIVLSGEMISFGSEGVHQYMGPGDWIAEEVLLQGSRSYSYRVRTASSVELAVIQVEEYDRFLARLQHLYTAGAIASSPAAVTTKLMHWFAHKGLGGDQKSASMAAAELGSVMVRNHPASQKDDRNTHSALSFNSDQFASSEAWRVNDDTSAIDVELDHAYQLHHLGMLQFDLRNTRAARRLLQEACQIRMLRLGPQSPVTMSTVRWLERVAKWQFRQKDREVQLKTVMKALKSIIKLGGIKGLLGAAGSPQTNNGQNRLPGLIAPPSDPQASAFASQPSQFLSEPKPKNVAETEPPEGDAGTSVQVRSQKELRECEKSGQEEERVCVVDEEEEEDAKELVGGSYGILKNRSHWIASMVKFAHGMRPQAPPKPKKLTAKLTGDRAIQHVVDQVIVLDPEEARLRAVSRAQKEMSEEWKGSHRAVVGILGLVCQDVAKSFDQPPAGGRRKDAGKKQPAVAPSSPERLSSSHQQKEAYHQMLQRMSGKRHELVSGMLNAGQCRRFGDGLCLLDLQAHRMQQWFPLTLMDAYDTVERVRWECATGLQLAGRAFVARRKLKFEQSIRALQRAWRGRVARRELRRLRVKKMAMWTEKKHTVGHDEAGWETRMRALRSMLEEAGHCAPPFPPLSPDAGARGGLEAEAG